MSITLDPSKVRGSPVAKSVIGKTGGKKVVDLTGRAQVEARASRVGVADQSDLAAEMTQALRVMVSKSGQPLFGGDPELPQLLDRMISYITGERHYGRDVGSGTRFGFLSHLARRLPPPILLDNEQVINDLFPPDCHTFAVDPAGRMWVCKDFFLKCLAADQKEGLMTLPVLNHEHLHIALNHTARLHNYEPRLSNIAKDTIINPMVVSLYPADTKFADEFKAAYGNREEDKRFLGLSEETVAAILQDEAIQAAADKGTIRIKLLEIVDGPVTTPVTHRAGKDQVLDLDHVIITVEEKFENGVSVGDDIDTQFDCATVEIEQTINRLKPRIRPSGKGKSSKKDNIVDIPVVSQSQSSEPGEGEGSPAPLGPRTASPSGDGEEQSGALNQNEGHEISMEQVKSVLAKHGFGDLVDQVIKPDEHSREQMDVIIEAAMTEGQLERARLGSYYPGAHIDDYMSEVVKPSTKHDRNVQWRQRLQEFLQGAGPLLSRSIEEQSVLSLLEPEDLGMDDDELPYLPGLIPTKPDGRIAVLIDSSGSMDAGRLCEAVSFIIALKKSANDMAPDIDIFSADTSLRGQKIELNDETIDRLKTEGVAIFGRGGTDITAPLNQLVSYAKENDLKYQGVLYITDFGLFAPPASALPPDLPALMFLGIPADYAAAEGVVKQLREYAEVVAINKHMNLDMDKADAKASIRGAGLRP